MLFLALHAVVQLARGLQSQRHAAYNLFTVSLTTRIIK
jgi:hypothetical protein